MPDFVKAGVNVDILQLLEASHLPMKKYLHIFLKLVLSLILITPILGSFGIFPAPTRDLYNTDMAFAFIQTMMTSYLVYGVALSCALGLLALWTGRTVLAMLLILPVTVNVVGFHAFLDGGLLTGGAVLGNIMLVINLYFLWLHRAELDPLLHPKS